MAQRSWVSNDEDEPHGDARAEKQEERSWPQHEAPEKPQEVYTSSREELIECIKRGEKPIWVPGPGLKELSARQDREREHKDREIDRIREANVLLQAVNRTENLRPSTHFHLDLEPIERPRSALHAGDFRERVQATIPARFAAQQVGSDRGDLEAHLGTSPPPWLSAAAMPVDWLHTDPLAATPLSLHVSKRARAPTRGSSLSSSFVMRIPTSPLVHAINNTSLDFSPRSGSTTSSKSSEKAHRRRTLPSEAFRSMQPSPTERRVTNYSRPLPPPPLRREASLPHQIHQPRRSLTTFTYQPIMPQQPATSSRTRRPSYGSDTTRRASMVGSFEESILRGRMSAPPSKPLDFVAQIGVLGKGNCKPSLKCPAHVTVPFPAVFYSYPNIGGSRSTIDDHPSPYVGNIDLEHNLKPVDPTRPRRPREPKADDLDEHIAQITAPENTAIGRALAREAKAKRTTVSSLKAPPGGSYRVPQQGQVQIIVKNPNKTAVKLYLVPYDLEGMESGSKTFVRQRSFSVGPILDGPLSEKQQTPSTSDPMKDKPILRYLVHLKFCCPSKGRFYLYDNIRIVFANRVPDGKEKLRNEVQVPLPKYSPITFSTSSRAAPAKRIEPWSLDIGLDFPNLDVGSVTGSEHFIDTGPQSPDASVPFHGASPTPQALARSEPCRAQAEPEHSGLPYESFNFTDQTANTGLGIPAPTAPTPGFRSSVSPRESPIPWSALGRISNTRSFSPAPVEAGDGLLSRKLRGLETDAEKS